MFEYDEETQIATIQQRNLFVVGDEIEFYGLEFSHLYQTIDFLWGEEGNPIDRAPNAMMIVKMKVNAPVKPYDMIRKRK
ncbi:U32 family peptidase C-terminal domain-containing protein [Bacillus sp. FJAT-49732]|uniref:U32 family peptidase C-terminal domain-containing protein n=1 Tax=Lederbergia citrisecunda TaxID=2833583 RepID=A0A942YP80_9BACI|nr:U32 family peptidase C-terminal domain-containing protein [Lederbergia citrisecunda]